MGMGMRSMIMTMKETRRQVEAHPVRLLLLMGFVKGNGWVSRGSATAYTVIYIYKTPFNYCTNILYIYIYTHTHIYIYIYNSLQLLHKYILYTHTHIYIYIYI